MYPHVRVKIIGYTVVLSGATRADALPPAWYM